jgi:HemY protein
VSPVSGRLDAFQWQTPVAALPSDKSGAIEARESGKQFGKGSGKEFAKDFENEFDDGISAPRRIEPPREALAEGAEKAGVTRQASAPAAQENIQDNVRDDALVNIQDNTPANSPASVTASEPAPSPAPPSTPPEDSSPAAAPLFRPRNDLGKNTAAIPPVIPIVRAPDDPGIDEDDRDEFAEPSTPPQGQAGGWRGFLARWGG